MLHSLFGEIVLEEWDISFRIRAELFCDVFVIMPNDIHAIVRIENAAATVETHGRASLPTGVAYRSPKSVSFFVACFKSVCTKRINELRNVRPVWQTRFHDHIIRNDAEYVRILNYIEHN